MLLVACHAQTLNLFVESFLRMVQKLLEDSNATLQILATNSVSVLLRFIYKHLKEKGRSLHSMVEFSLGNEMGRSKSSLN